MKVILTNTHSNILLTRIIMCDTLRYFEDKHKVSMYNAKGQLIAYVITDDFEEISYINDKEQEHFIKRLNK